ncbi:MAG: signal peptidase I [Chloroflexi bacterium]|nr:signal peptidase I [Chloroflexota bacterium]
MAALVRLLLAVVGLLVGMLAVAVASNRRAAVRGVSMAPLLGPGERVLVDRLAYVRLAYPGRSPKRGDVALVRNPTAGSGQATRAHRGSGHERHGPPGARQSGARQSGAGQSGARQSGAGQPGLTPPELLLKRIVGLPGEAVEVRRDRLWIDGRPLDLGRPVVGSSPGRWNLGPDEYFVLSDNLAIGTDSRHIGPARRSDLLGRAWLVYFPSVRRIH